jgi:SAM-dependent methyltransferase
LEKEEIRDTLSLRRPRRPIEVDIRPEESPVGTMNDAALIESIGRYKWYHRIRVRGDICTPSYLPSLPSFQDAWDLILAGMAMVDFRGKRVLDVGCRDGLFSFEAEHRGAEEVIGIDNDISRGAVEFLIPFFDSRVRMYEMNLYDITPDRFGRFDVIVFPGVLYHLRYPFWGLKQLLSCLSDNGILLIESGMLVEPGLDGHELLYCPVENSPYEPTSCTFFNAKALTTTLRAFQCRLFHSKMLSEVENRRTAPRYEGLSGFFRKYRKSLKSAARKKFRMLGNGETLSVDRQLFLFEKSTDQGVSPWVKPYWDATHKIHTVGEDPRSGPS